VQTVKLIEQKRWKAELKSKQRIADTKNMKMGHLETKENLFELKISEDLYKSMKSYSSESI